MGTVQDIAALQTSLADVAARVEALEKWIRAFEAGPIGNVPWAQRPVPPPATAQMLANIKRAKGQDNATRKATTDKEG